MNNMKSEKKTVLILAFFFAIILFSKNILFQWLCFHSLYVSAAITDTRVFFLFYAQKLLPAIIIPSFLFLTKRKGWSFVFLILLDLWIVANLIYYRANQMFLDIPAIVMVNNLAGFESSINTYFKLEFLLFPVTTALYFICFVLLRSQYKIPQFFNATLIIVICLYLSIGYTQYCTANKDVDSNKAELTYKNCGARIFLPFYDILQFSKPNQYGDALWAPMYIYKKSIIHYGLAIIIYRCSLPKHLTSADVSKYEKTFSAFIGSPKDQSAKASNSIVLVLVESLESWVFENPRLAELVAPNLNRLIKSERTSYFKSVTSMVKHGVSGDGQMIVLSGLLPINSGAACMLYGNNVWPGIPQVYDDSFIVDPANGIWNQHVMSNNYGFHSSIESRHGMTDGEVFDKLCERMSIADHPFFSMAITIATHAPFYHINNPDLAAQLPGDMPESLRNYLICLNYTDTCIGKLINLLNTDDYYSNTTLIITGDHTVFKNEALKEYANWPSSLEYCIPETTSYCPLFIYSPQVESNSICDDIVYQMDIYPTLLSLSGCDSYYWKGFGVDLLQGNNANRAVSIDEAYRLSDLLIRSDYFRKVK